MVFYQVIVAVTEKVPRHPVEDHGVMVSIQSWWLRPVKRLLKASELLPPLGRKVARGCAGRVGGVVHCVPTH